MDKTKAQLKQIIQKPMGDDDIKLYLPNAKIISYPDLIKYSDIEQILTKSIDYFILLYQLEDINNGHWVAVLKYLDIIEYFDPYGNKIDAPLKWVSQTQNTYLHQYKPYLTNLLNTTDYHVIYNPIDYQDEKNNVNTCGRHCCFRVLNLIKNNKSLNDYYLIMKKLKLQSRLSYDQIVSEFISKI